MTFIQDICKALKMQANLRVLIYSIVVIAVYLLGFLIANYVLVNNYFTVIKANLTGATFPEDLSDYLL